MQTFLDFEKNVAELNGKIEELRLMANSKNINVAEEVMKLERKSEKALTKIYAELTPWQKVQVARHQQRPKFFDYLNTLFTDFMPLAGDRVFGNDHALIGGMARFKGKSVVVIGQQKGTDTESRLHHNFGMPRPEGYRKAKRLMELANQFNMPILTFVDTAGAYPGLDAEERGQAEAIARCIETSFNLTVPLISCIIGEGGSGGAIAIASANSVFMLEHSIYSVISPEGCASILWKSAQRTKDAANALKLTAQDLQKHKIIDAIIPEPLGGAHRNISLMTERTRDVISSKLNDLSQLSGQKLKQMRRQRFIDIGDKDL
ncbi:MAG: acetyl-CoA carboxylase carboxyl transferase subunit alpha [Alphaproteobacteria bacterium CG_4_10_14_0_8_um_filter_37_21]|nr:MAG: acetyl-CoA carboxylase carboxyl transferase subunit alpha [Alphaproteobacteria bacterium CG_4_10_14_0_8_um_filter_37_21]